MRAGSPLRSLALVLAAAFVCAGVVPAAAAEGPYDGHWSTVYENESMWLCLPGVETDYCRDADLTATQILPDGRRRAVHDQPATDPGFDCFYVYPTVDMGLLPGNNTNLGQVREELDPLLSQAAPFRGLCRIYAPLHRQVSIGTFTSDDAQRFSDIAYGDVLDAFKHYMANHNDGRRYVLIGHSQGSGHLTRLLREEIEQDPALLEDMISALLIGGGVHTPPGEVVGGSFQNVPLCTSATQTGCVVAYNSLLENAATDGYNVPLGLFGGDDGVGDAPDGFVNVCTNPVDLTGGPAVSAGSTAPDDIGFLSLLGMVRQHPPGVTTPFLYDQERFVVECVADGGQHVLSVRLLHETDDQRPTPSLPNVEGMGLHLADFNVVIDDLVRLVATQAGVPTPARTFTPLCDLTGTPGPDVLTGTGRAETICGLEGDDRIDGGGGNDVLVGGADNDVLDGGAGHDIMLGGTGSDRLVTGFLEFDLAQQGTGNETTQEWFLATLHDVIVRGDSLTGETLLGVIIHLALRS